MQSGARRELDVAELVYALRNDKERRDDEVSDLDDAAELEARAKEVDEVDGGVAAADSSAGPAKQAPCDYREAPVAGSDGKALREAQAVLDEHYPGLYLPLRPELAEKCGKTAPGRVRLAQYWHLAQLRMLRVRLPLVYVCVALNRSLQPPHKLAPNAQGPRECEFHAPFSTGVAIDFVNKHDLAQRAYAPSVYLTLSRSLRPRLLSPMVEELLRLLTKLSAPRDKLNTALQHLHHNLSGDIPRSTYELEHLRDVPATGTHTTQIASASLTHS